MQNRGLALVNDTVTILKTINEMQTRFPIEPDPWPEFFIHQAALILGVGARNQFSKDEMMGYFFALNSRSLTGSLSVDDQFDILEKLFIQAAKVTETIFANIEAQYKYPGFFDAVAASIILRDQVHTIGFRPATLDDLLGYHTRIAVDFGVDPDDAVRQPNQRSTAGHFYSIFCTLPFRMCAKNFEDFTKTALHS
jgi:hypothetical protein